MKGEVQVFIGRVHGRRSGTSIQDTDQPTSDTCHRIKCFCNLSDLTDMMASPSVNLPPRVLVTNTHETLTVINHLVFVITVLVLCYVHLRHPSPHEYGPSLSFVLTVTPIERLHDGDGSNGVKGAAEEDKI